MAERATMANNFYLRLMGLMGRKSLDPYDALVLHSDLAMQSIHTFFMRFSIDVIFLNKKMKVLKIVKKMKPFRMTRLVWGASTVIELTAGSVESKIKEGDILEFIYV